MASGISGRPDLLLPWLDRLAGQWPDRVALILPEGNETFTYRDLQRRANAAAAWLSERGVGRGDRVAALLHNGVTLIDLIFACGRLGAILAPLNWRLSPRELAELVFDLEPSLILTEPEFRDLAQAARGRVPLTLLTNGPASATELAAADHLLPPITTCMDDSWIILFTGGTTGTAKGALLTHGSITWNAINTAVSWGLASTDLAPVFTPSRNSPRRICRVSAGPFPAAPRSQDRFSPSGPPRCASSSKATA